MYAIIETSGKQYRVEQGDTLVVDRMDAEPGSTIALDRVLLVGGPNDVKIGTPCVDGAKVNARVLEHPKGKKIISTKYRPRKRYRRRIGYRHSHTTLEILGIDL